MSALRLLCRASPRWRGWRAALTHPEPAALEDLEGLRRALAGGDAAFVAWSEALSPPAFAAVVRLVTGATRADLLAHLEVH